MKVYRVIKLSKGEPFFSNEGRDGEPKPIQVRHKIKHKLKWKPEKMLRKLWSSWL